MTNQLESVETAQQEGHMNTNMAHVDKSYVSEHDAFLHDFDKGRARSLSQQQEYNKHQCVYQQRDGKGVVKSGSFIRRLLRFVWPM